MAVGLLQDITYILIALVVIFIMHSIGSATETNQKNDQIVEENVEMININKRDIPLIATDGYIRSIFNQHSQIMPTEIAKIIYKFIYKVLLIQPNETKTLKSDFQHVFHSVVIGNGSMLTVNDWNEKTKNGGKLLIKSLNDFVIKKGGMILLTGKGYKGGKNDMMTGESYNTPSLKQWGNNLGGGGPGWSDDGCDIAGGGGYGTKGGGKYGRGAIYGDATLKMLHLGSGGGGYGFYGNDYWGGNGGGALKIECVTFSNNGQIIVNGGDGGNSSCGAGSGGSILIICNDFIMDSNDRSHCLMTAVGGSNSSKGGDGRIRIKSSFRNISRITKLVNNGQIKPNPYIA